MTGLIWLPREEFEPTVLFSSAPNDAASPANHSRRVSVLTGLFSLKQNRCYCMDLLHSLSIESESVFLWKAANKAADLVHNDNSCTTLGWTTKECSVYFNSDMMKQCIPFAQICLDLKINTTGGVIRFRGGAVSTHTLWGFSLQMFKSKQRETESTDPWGKALLVICCV